MTPVEIKINAGPEGLSSWEFAKAQGARAKCASCPTKSERPLIIARSGTGSEGVMTVIGKAEAHDKCQHGGKGQVEVVIFTRKKKQAGS